eukprot:scaffold68564_cov18-Tisochrysis_lutea.AAC.2
MDLGLLPLPPPSRNASKAPIKGGGVNACMKCAARQNKHVNACQHMHGTCCASNIRWQHTQAVPAGSVLAMGGLDAAILKSATLSSTPMARPLAPMIFQVNMIGGCVVPRVHCKE